MNVRTALISSALLLAVLGWACEQQGPTSPSALGTPGGVTVDAAGGGQPERRRRGYLGGEAKLPRPQRPPMQDGLLVPQSGR